MTVLILAGGYGTRLRSVAQNTAKALLKVAGRPIIDYALDHLVGLDLRQVVVVTNDKFFEDFESWRGSHPQKDLLRLKVVNDGTRTNEERLGSIGDIDFVLKTLTINDDLLVMGGDNLFNFDIGAYVAFSRQKMDNATIGLFDINDKDRATQCGVVELDAQKKLVSFEEKPAQPKSSLISMCLYYFPHKTLGLVGEYLLESGKSDRAGDYIVWLMKKTAIYGFIFTGKWFDIGSIESYNEAQKAYSHS